MFCVNLYKVWLPGGNSDVGDPVILGLVPGQVDVYPLLQQSTGVNFDHFDRSL